VKVQVQEFVKKGKKAFLSDSNLVVEGTHFVYRKPLPFHLDIEGEVPLWVAPLLFSNGVNVGHEGNTLFLSGEDYVLRIPLSVGKPTPLPTGGDGLSLPRKVAREMGKLVPFSGDNPPFSAIYWDGERAVATDRFLFTALTHEGRKLTSPLLLPKEGVSLLSKLASSWEGGDYLEGHFGEGWFRVEAGEDELTLFLIGGEFPKFDSVLGVPREGVGVEVEVPLLKEALALAQKVGDLACLTFGEGGALLEVSGHFGHYQRLFPWRRPGVAFVAKLSPLLLSDLLSLFRQQEQEEQERVFVHVAGHLIYLWNEEGLFAATSTL